jgi:prepilin-type N-terminal cleavage/methylation domain-containing protein/prepilin-type processing-associated H-X9-DG protein
MRCRKSVAGAARLLGFTLIELLVVIAIIAILAAILFPVFAQARMQARKANSQSISKQMSLAMIMYAQDYDETFVLNQPTWTQGSETIQWCWSYLLWSYYKNNAMLGDPSDSSLAIGSTTADYGNGEHTLLYNEMLSSTVPTDSSGHANVYGPGSSGLPLTEASVVSPSDCMLLAQGHTWQWGGFGNNTLPDPTGYTGADSKYKGYNCLMFPWGTAWVTGRTYMGPTSIMVTGLPIYETGAVFSFVDGHVKYFKVLDTGGNPIIESTLPWYKNVDPQQRLLGQPADTANTNCWTYSDCWI